MSETPSSMAATGKMPPVMTSALIGFGLFLVGGLAGWIGHGALAGPDDVPTMRVYDEWRLLCPTMKDKNESCQMSQDVADSKGEPVARVVMVRDKDKSMVMAVTVPLGVLLEPGLGLKVGDDQVKVFQYKTCTEAGCVSIVPVDNKLQDSIGVAKVFGVAVAGRDGKAVDIPVSTKGFAQARNAFMSNEGLRASWWRRLWS